MKAFTPFRAVFVVMFSLLCATTEAQVYYDDWPVTRKSNDRSSNIDKGDYTTNFVPIGTVWNRRIITYFFQNGTADIAGDGERQAVRDGFALWASRNVRFLEVCNANAADIVILWGTFGHGDPNPPCTGGVCNFDGQNGVLAHNLGGPPPNDFGNIAAGDTHFDDSETWTLALRNGNAQPIDLVTVAAHEIGHALGLDHTQVAGSLMLANYNGSHRFLGSDDRAGILSLYPQGDLIVGPTTVCTVNNTFNLQNVPAGTNVTWTVTGGFTPSSGTGANATFRATNNSPGTGILTYTLNSGCATTAITRTINRNMSPIRMAQTTYNGPYATIYASVDPVPGALSYEWYLNGQFQQVSSYNHEFTVDDCGSYYTSVRVRTSACSWSAQSSISFYVTCSGGNFMVYPNPANEQLTIEQTTGSASTLSASTIETSFATPGWNTATANPSFRVELYNDQQKLVAKGTAKNAKIQLDTSKLPAGAYYLQIYNKEGTIQKQVIIE